MNETANGPAGTGGEPQALSMREQRLQRNLKILVVGMGVLIFAGLGAIAFRVVQMGRTPTGASILDGRGTAAKAGQIDLQLPRDAKILSIALDGNRLAIQHESPAGSGITILDLATGKPIAEIKPVHEIPRN